MNVRQTNTAQYLRTLLILGRVSNLPTVWSNCLAGWFLGGGGDWSRFAGVCGGSTLLYVGGMYLNDAFDAQFDQQHRPERPIPSGAIGTAAVWGWGMGWLLLGLTGLSFLGTTTALLAALLALNILIYDAIHKIFALSPVLMALCRFFLILVAASASSGGLTGGTSLTIWSALVLAIYIVGVSYLARQESTRTHLRYWPCVFLAAPVVLALVVNQGGFQGRGFLLASIFIIWTVGSMRLALWVPQPNIGRCVAALLAGIVLVDLLALGGGTPGMGLSFLALFLLALLAQQFIPAT